MSDKIEQGVYEHFKGGQYDVIGVAGVNLEDLFASPLLEAVTECLMQHGTSLHRAEAHVKDSTQGEVVVYRPLYGNDRRMRIRSISNFTEQVERDVERNGETVHYEGPRFRKIFGNQKGPA